MHRDGSNRSLRGATSEFSRPFLNDLAASCGRELGVTDWLTDAAEADAYDIVTGLAPDFDLHPPGPGRPLPVNPFYLATTLRQLGVDAPRRV